MYFKKNMTERYLIVGLGNPGREYENTRHNIGFRCVETLAQKHHLTFDRKKKSKAKLADGIIAGKQVLIAKPQTYMNLSGTSVQGLSAFYRIPPARIIVLFDDLDLPLGTLRIRPKGGSGGHRGLTDIIQRLGTQNFPRIRFGIGRPPGQMDPAAFVLRPFTPEENEQAEPTVQRAVQTLERWLTEGIDSAMNHYNGSIEEVSARQRAAEADTPPLSSSQPDQSS